MRLVKGLFCLLLVLVIGGGLALGYAFKIEPKILVERVYNLDQGSAGGDAGIEVIQISDTHVSEHYTPEQMKKMVKKINDRNADIIVFTGDLFDNFAVYKNQDAVVDQLSQLSAKNGKYAVWGNRDYGGGASRVYKEIMEQSGFRLLKNESAVIELEGGSTLGIGGVDDFLLGTPDIRKTVSGLEECDYKLLLLHEPDKAEDLKDSGVDLILTGHSHGGQVRIPFYKGITTSLAETYIRGFYTINDDTGLQVFVNTGIGTTRIPARFMVPPEIAVFQIKI